VPYSTSGSHRGGFYPAYRKISKSDNWLASGEIAAVRGILQLNCESTMRGPVENQ
jgi:hypothetical protein